MKFKALLKTDRYFVLLAFLLLSCFAVSARAMDLDSKTDACAQRLNSRLEARMLAGLAAPSEKAKDWYMWLCQTTSAQSNLGAQRIPVALQGSDELAYRNFVAGCMMMKADAGMKLGAAFLFCEDLYKTTFKVAL